jgi:radical S-adenosyl methionine domain-containing protein 2
MRCGFCFATFQDVKKSILPKGHLSKEKAIKVVEELADYGFKKITFVGGEPTLCPWLFDLIKIAKIRGLTTSIVTNGLNLSDTFLSQNQDYLDWIAISVDSLNDKTNIETGRAKVGKTPISVLEYKNLVDKVKMYRYGLKINTVVSKKNHNENLSEFINYAQPKRWKVFQVLPIKGQNDQKIDEFLISSVQFNSFIQLNQNIRKEIKLVSENNDEMKGTYAMIDPAGRFFCNLHGEHNYSLPILEVGVGIALKQMEYDTNKFINRGGLYDWEIKKKLPSRITLSGEVASGKSSVGIEISKLIGYQFISIGNVLRQEANKLNMSIVEYQKNCIKNPEQDKNNDLLFSKECNSKNNIVIDYRLGFLFINKGYNILLKISQTAAINRLKTFQRVNETYETLRERNNAFKKQFLSNYKIDYLDERNYDLVINVENYNSPKEIAEIIVETLINRVS